MNTRFVAGGASVPAGARPVARILLLDTSERLLLLQAVHAADGYRFWTAHRELREETGLDLAVDRSVWTRHHIYSWNGRPCNQYERFFVARTAETDICPRKQDSHVVAHRWWALSQLL